MTEVFWTDSHCHLDFPDFAEEGVAALIERARLTRVGHMLTISTHTQRLDRYVKIADRFANVWTTIGVHPHQANEPGESDVTVDRLVAMANSHAKIVGIGECGLDYHYDYAPKEIQQHVFRTHIRAAIETGLPIIIHARQADEDVIKILQEEGAGNKPLRGVFHCFSSGPALAAYALEVGFYISFSGIVTFPKAKEIHDICRSISLNKLLIETDAPYLAPVPYRGKRNEPAFVRHTGRFIADLHHVSEADLARQTTNNFFHLFNKIKGQHHVER